MYHKWKRCLNISNTLSVWIETGAPLLNILAFSWAAGCSEGWFHIPYPISYILYSISHILLFFIAEKRFYEIIRCMGENACLGSPDLSQDKDSQSFYGSGCLRISLVSFLLEDRWILFPKELKRFNRKFNTYLYDLEMCEEFGRE